VFFEKALELCRSPAGSPMLEGQAYEEYGVFRSRLGQGQEARTLLERASEIFQSLGERPELERVHAQLLELSA
jgi:hypothetical protein